MTSIHPARLLSYAELRGALEEAKAAKLVSARRHGDHSIWCYTPACVYGREWNGITLLARGLILDDANERVVATPFPKFFNLGERGNDEFDSSFEVYEKLDGSLIIIWHDGEHWRTATKGSLTSDQAAAAARILEAHNLDRLVSGLTYLAEYVGPANRIVVPYEREELVLLAAYDERGYELTYPLIQAVADELGWRAAERLAFDSIAELVERAAELPATEEGFVLRFQDGHRLKIKGDQYRRIHALISRCTPLAMWEAMLNGDNLGMIRDQLPDEFLGDFDAITGILDGQVNMLISRVATEAQAVSHLSDKEVGLRLHEWPDPVRSLIFPYRKNADFLSGRARQAVFRAIRPTGNVLPGYTPSYAMNRLAEESL